MSKRCVFDASDASQGESFSKEDFRVVSSSEVVCPNKKVLRVAETRCRNDEQVLRFAAKKSDCMACSLRPRCTELGEKSSHGRRLDLKKSEVEKVAPLRGKAIESGSEPLYWYDRESTRMRRLITRDQKAHRRLSWKQRLRRNERTFSSPMLQLILFGLAPQIAAWIGFSAT